MEKGRYEQNLCYVYVLITPLVEVACAVTLLYHSVKFVYLLSYCSQVGQTLQRAKKRMKDQFNKFGFGKMKKKDGSVEETPGSKFIFNEKLFPYFCRLVEKSLQLLANKCTYITFTLNI